MKNLTKIFFCSFAFLVLISCEPEEIPQSMESSEQEDIYAETGDQKNDVDDKK